MSQLGYLASSEFDSNVAWKRDGFSHSLVNVHNVSEALTKPNEIREDAVMVVVGVVLPNRLNVSPRGNFSTQYTTDITTSKFQLLLGPPPQPE